MLVLWEITKLDKTSVGHLCESIGLMRFPPLMSPRTQVLVSCSETERANHMWRCLGPPSTTAGIYHLVQGPQLVRVFMRLLSVLMTCLLSAACVAFTFCSPGRRAFTFLYCLGRGTILRSGCVQSHFRASDLS